VVEILLALGTCCAAISERRDLDCHAITYERRIQRACGFTSRLSIHRQRQLHMHLPLGSQPSRYTCERRYINMPSLVTGVSRR
jgi:hypothetical protein